MGKDMAKAERTGESAGAPHEPVAVEYGQSAKHAIYIRDDEREGYGRSMRARTTSRRKRQAVGYLGGEEPRVVPTPEGECNRPDHLEEAASDIDRRAAATLALSR